MAYGQMKNLCAACLFVPPVVATLLATPPTGAMSHDPLSFDFGRVPVLAEDELERIVSDRLQENPNTSSRLVVPDKCEGQGERELSRLAAEGSLEEAYAYLPALCLWIEIGFSETRSSVRLDSEFVEALLKDYSTVVLYHTHVGVPDHIASVGVPDHIASYFPAYSDLLGLVLVNGKFLREPEVKIYHRAVTSLGIFEYAFVLSEQAEKIVESIFRTGLGDFVSQNLAYAYANRTYEQMYYAAVKECDELLHGTPENLESCFPMRASDFIVDYRAVQQ